MVIKRLEDNEEDRIGFNKVYIKGYNGIRDTPHCLRHGAMNLMIDGSGRRIWRCLSEYGYELKEDQTCPTFRDRTCNACCIEVLD